MNPARDLCHQYACFRILVCDSDGKPIGRVKEGGRCFSTMDAALHDFWHWEIDGVEIP